MAHYYDDPRIVPDAPGGWEGSPGAGAMSDWLHRVQIWLRGWDDEPEWRIYRDDPEIPMGGTDFFPGPTVTGDELSDLVIAESPGIPPPVLDTVAAVSNGGDITQHRFYYPGITWRGIEYMERQELATQEAEAILPQPIREEVTDMDFWDDLGDVFIDWISPMTQPDFMAPFAPQADPSTVPMTGPAPGVPPVSPGACAPGAGASPVYKKVCGVYKWVYPKRRRRRQLLTESDYNGLLRIEGLKVNKNMTIAIAKALTR